MSWAILILRWEDQLVVLCAKADKTFTRQVQQNVFPILKSVPVTYVKDPELIRPSISVLTDSLNQRVLARKAKARKCTAEIVSSDHDCAFGLRKASKVEKPSSRGVGLHCCGP